MNMRRTMNLSLLTVSLLAINQLEIFSSWELKISCDKIRIWEKDIGVVSK